MTPLRLRIFLLFGAVCTLNAAVAQVSDTLYIVAGTYTAFDSAQWQCLAFSKTTDFQGSNDHITVSAGQSLDLWIINQDTSAHQVTIGSSSQLVQPSSSAMFELSALDVITTIKDTTQNHRFTGLGLSTFIYQQPTNHNSFYWHLMEFERKRMPDLVNGSNATWHDYDPDYFTINGKSNPHVNADPQARVTGNVGDTIYIVAHNGGMSHHSLHFHGYHLEVLYSTRTDDVIGRRKDTFPVHRGESLLFRLVPHQPGEYPVHDHNLVAVSGGGIYPNGMFTTMLISP